ncbi:MAG: FeoB-associated Cys-rich membrane protein [Cyclobacteriaceae bacterium]
MQNLLIGLIFISASAYLTRLIWKSFQQRGQCQSGCSKCSTTPNRWIGL